MDLRTTACTTADRANPRINAQRISQVIDPANASACPIALTTTTSSRVCPGICQPIPGTPFRELFGGFWSAGHRGATSNPTAL